jgi:hypothetical protein
MIISFEDISVQSVTCFRCIRAPDVTSYPARGKTYFYVKSSFGIKYAFTKQCVFRLVSSLHKILFNIPGCNAIRKHLV